MRTESLLSRRAPAGIIPSRAFVVRTTKLTYFFFGSFVVGFCTAGFFVVLFPSEPGRFVEPVTPPFVTVIFRFTISAPPEDIAMDSNRTALIREAMKHAEAKQLSLLQIALAADTRGMTLCVACAGISGVLIGIDAVGSDATVSLSVLMIAVGFFIAACLSAWSARPIDFDAPGQDFRDFQTDIDEGRHVDTVLVELGAHLDDCSKKNATRLNNNAMVFRVALFVAALSPLIGVMTLLVNA